MKLEDLLREVERITPEGGAWCSIDKSRTLATIVATERPELVVEIGVWQGGSLVPMCLAMRENEVGSAIAIDPWSPTASVAGQIPENAEWWSKVDHERAYRAFVERLRRHELAGICSVVRAASDAVDPHELGPIGLLHVDGNHSEQAARDVERFAPCVIDGGILVLDDLDWTGGHVRRGQEIARGFGFVDLYTLDTGCVMRRFA